MNEEQRWKAVRECVAKGDKAKAKAEDWYITAGQHLKTLKAEHAGTWAEWEIKVKERAGIGKSRASELMQIADGTKTVDEVRASGAEREAARRERKKLSPSRDGETRQQPKPKLLEAEAVTEMTEMGAGVEPVASTRDDIGELLESAREKLRAAEIKIAGLESEVEELKTENAELRKKLAADGSTHWARNSS